MYITIKTLLKMKFLLSLLGIFLLADSCNSKNKTMGKIIDQNSLYGNYIVTQLNDNAMENKKLKIVFEANTNNVSGFGGCNSFLT